MKRRPITDVTSWAFLAAIHGIDQGLWTQYGYLTDGQAMPTQAQADRYIGKCQHQSWYFLPWHRGYLLAFESIVRAAVVAAGGPADWALPYWNYNNPDEAKALQLPSAFADPKMPDGSDNPLYVAQRYGAGQTPITLPPRQIRPIALGVGAFADGDNPEFGGPVTTFHHGGEDQLPSGGLESEPHNNVHGAVGGGTNAGPGLMSDPDTAALDPIFWLHHANIDRMWEIWLQNAAHTNPTDQDTWMTGPADGPFAMPTATGGDWPYAAKDMLSIAALGYAYQSLASPVAPARRQNRMAALGATPARLAAIAREAPMPSKPAEVIGSSEAPVPLGGGPVTATVRLDAPSVAGVARSLAAAPQMTAGEPDRVFLKLDNIRSPNDGAIVSVYAGLPDGADPAQHPEAYVGAISMFGARKATRTDGGRAGNGLSQVFEITGIVDALHQAGRLADLKSINVRFVPEHNLEPGEGASVGRVSLLRRPA